VMMGRSSLGGQLMAGVGTVTGNAGVLQRLAGLLVDFDPNFAIMPGTAPVAAAGDRQ